MKTWLALTLALGLLPAPLSAQNNKKPAEKKQIVLFAHLEEDSPVDLEDGARWMMEKGETFPVLMFKEQQTRVILQLAGTRFAIPTSKVRILEEKDVTPEMLASYRRNVDNYLETQAKKWREEAKAKP